MNENKLAVLIFPYGGIHKVGAKTDLFFQLLETAIGETPNPVVLVVNHDTVSKHPENREVLQQKIDAKGWKDALDIQYVWSVDTCQMWLHGWGHVIDNYSVNRIILLPGDLSALRDPNEFFKRKLRHFINLDRADIILGDFTTGEEHSAKDLIDQYGTLPLMANWFPEAARKILQKPIQHPRTEFLNFDQKTLKDLLANRKFAYEQTLNMLIRIWYEQGEDYWEFSVDVEPLGQVQDESGFRKYRDCLDQIERMERMLKVLWREKNWDVSNPPSEDKISRFEYLDKRSTSIRETARIIIKNMLDVGT